jgi:hypothetical protein
MFKVFEEIEDKWGIQFFDGDIAGPLVQALVRKGQQQPKAVTVRGHSARAHVPLLKEPLRKELLQQDWKRLHR